ncbi:Ubiquitin-conjugating enzyme like [Actinidia chinensis var. chinensis]|uniref:E2 ubiquitin-conjugating enzyme n=1 Tax=Actinidia chinensis var. chinensis TaxID=1590841 RepID=A0A2R6QWP9_ACTCC|nr:Ubiquitin-conjugating enzyme like [Actinidia chinensis var. chinensis]
MESPPLAVYIPQQSKKRVFPGSSSSYMDPDVVEISPPMSWSSKSKSLKHKEIIQHEVIDIDMVEESGDIMLIDEKVDKGKESLATFSCGHDNSAKTGSVDGFQSSKKSSAPEPNNSSNLEGFSNDFSYCDDEYMDTYHDNLTYDDEYAFLQAHFDSIDIPPGVEAPIPWFPGPSHNIKNSASIYSSNYSCFPNQLDISGTDSSHPFGLPELEQSGPKSPFVSNSSLKTHMDTRCHPQQVLVPSSWSFAESAENNNKSSTSTSSTYLNSPSEKGDMKHPAPYKSGCITGFSLNNEKPAVSGSTTSYTSHSQLDTMQLPLGMDLPSKGYYLRSRRKKLVGNGNITYPKFSTMDTTNLPPGVVAHSGWMRSSVFVDNPYFMSDGIHNAVNLISEKEPYNPWVHDPANSDKSSTAAGSSAVPSGSLSITEKHGNEDDILKKFQLFKQFDVVQDHSDHHYSGKGSSLKQPSKTWAKKIQDEWRILEKDLPDTIFVRVYESRMDLLRAVIVGAEGTPYHDGLFFFDVFFPSGYPNVPPLVYYHSGGLRINPNLYNCGKVCLSLLNTWSGSQNEKWIPGVSTMLQVLVSIQALILNEQPYFNEPGYARMSGSPNGEKNSRQYNENTFILSLKTMVYTMRRPPKHFEDFVGGHFCKRAQDILVACKAYMDGAQVGCLARGGVQDVDAGDKSCSQCFKDNLASYITILVQTFSQTGAKDCNKFLSLAEKGNSRVSSTTMLMNMPVPVPMPIPMPMTSNYF